MDERSRDDLKFGQGLTGIVGLVGIGLCALGYWLAPQRFFEAYLFAFLSVSGIGLGCLAMVMLHHLVGGRWGRATRRVLEAASWPLVITPLLAIPLWFGLARLYPWTDSSLVEHDPLLAHKAPYLNLEFFQWRAVGYLAIWALLALVLSWWSRVSDRGRPAATRGIERLSAWGIVIYMVTMTFAAIDWMMSLEPHWFSTIYGIIVVAGQGAAAFCVAIAALSWLRNDDELLHVATSGVFQDLGNLLLAAVTFWIYVSFSQFLIIWSGNLAEEAPWYLARASGGWQWVALALVLLHFVFPFAALLSATVKRDPRYLLPIAVLVAWLHVVDVYWLVMPALRETFFVHILDLVALTTLAALWKSISLWRLQSGALVPYTSAAANRRPIPHHGNVTTVPDTN